MFAKTPYMVPGPPAFRSAFLSARLAFTLGDLKESARYLGLATLAAGRDQVLQDLVADFVKETGVASVA